MNIKEAGCCYPVVFCTQIVAESIQVVGFFFTINYLVLVVDLFDCQRVQRQMTLTWIVNCDGSKVWRIRQPLRTSVQFPAINSH